MKYATKYVSPVLTVDLILFRVIDGRLNVLLLNRPANPFKDYWSLPGGYAPRGETTLEALRRIMSYKIGIDVKKLAYLDQLRAFDTVARDPRGHAVSIAYIAADNSVKPTKTAAEVAFFPVDNLPELAYDHQDIIQLGRDRLILEVNHTNLIKTLLPPLFTMADIQAAYEAVFGRELDKRNFQKKFFKLNQVTATGKFKYNANSRPAKLYKFNTSTINQLSNNLD